MDKVNTGFRSFFLLSVSLVLAGCELTGGLPDGTTRDPALVPISESEVIGAGPGPGCSSASLSSSGSSVVASLPENSCARLRLCVDPLAWKDLPQNTYVPGIDIVILFDVTGSMRPYIEAMVGNIQQLANNLSVLTPSLRLGLASFRDFGDRSGDTSDRPYLFHTALTSDVNKVRDALGTLRARGGGDVPESLATAVKAAVDGQGLSPYFTANDMGFSEDPTRIKIVLGVTDAMNRRSKLPAGVPTLEKVAALMKEKGILFLGIGYRSSQARYEWNLENGSSDRTSFDDLAYLARMTGAVAKAPGVDLDGDGFINTKGEILAGAPAVLLMSPSGQLEGAPRDSNPTRVLADAITEMVKRIKPFQFSLAIDGEGRTFLPATNYVTVAPESTEQGCFVPVQIGARGMPAPGSCPALTEVRASVSEELSATSVDTTLVKAVLEFDVSCLGSLPEPEPTSSVTPTPTVTPTSTPTPTPTICVGPGCGGGVIGL